MKIDKQELLSELFKFATGWTIVSLAMFIIYAYLVLFDCVPHNARTWVAIIYLVFIIWHCFRSVDGKIRIAVVLNKIFDKRT
jgi:hypothetical protein